MKITAIPQIYRHINRWGEIISVLSKYELANWIGRLGPNFAKDLLKARGGDSIARLRWETRVRMALAELGPTFIKLGQVLSTRPDVVGVELATELEHLQTDVPGDPPEVVRATIEKELGRPIGEVFSEFDDQPMASASIGQVHRARLFSGEAVVVKVQHADIQRKIEIDLDILAGLAQLADRIPEFQNYRPQAIVAEFKRTLRHELDFAREERNMQQFARDFSGDSTVHIPTPYPGYCARRVLTMEMLDGVKVAETDRLRKAGVDLDEIARRGADVTLQMIFDNGFYHADPHPGNILVLDGSVIGLLDYGMVGRIDDQLQEDIGEMLAAISSQDAEMLTSLILRMGAAPANLDRAGLSLEVADFVAYYGSVPLQQLDLGGALKEITEAIRRYHVMLPARIAMLLKALITLDGTARTLSPRFSLIEVMVPYHRKMLWRRFSPRRRFRKLRRLYSEVEHLVSILPRGIVDILEQVQTGKFDVHLDHRGLEPSVNRLVLGMLASALFLGSSLLLARAVSPTFSIAFLGVHDISAVGAAGYVVSVALGLRLWRAINKSGRLDRRKD
jgi:ubiquinone biosynthesis protein